jgi:protein-L-isoaspartate(D-aspartate) O-methyltransferase
LKDTDKHKGLRNQLVSHLKEKGIVDKNVLAAIGSIPRHFFLDSSFENFAYQDKAFPNWCDQTISQPYTVAFQTQLLGSKKRSKNIRNRNRKWLSNSRFICSRCTSI